MAAATRYAICCTTQIDPDTLNRFIQAEQSHRDDPSLQFFVFVDALGGTYTTGPGYGLTEPTAADTPFAGQSVGECLETLQQIRQRVGEGEIDGEGFAIMDARSMEDDTVLVVNAKRECRAVRAEFAFAVTAMMCWMTGNSSIGEDVSRAEETVDGVLRWHDRKA